MYLSKSAVLSVVLVACVIVVTSAMECFQCETTRNGPCGPFFSRDRQRTCNGGICRTTINKEIGKRIDYRSRKCAVIHPYELFNMLICLESVL